MDAAEFDAIMATEKDKLGAPPVATPAVDPAAPPAGQAASPVDMGALGDAMSQLTGAGTQPASAAPAVPAPTGNQLVDNTTAALGEMQGGNSKMIGLPGVAQAFGLGGIDSMFQTKDFLFGATPPEDRSAYRSVVDARSEQLSAESRLNGFSKGIGQFAIGMLGVGKLVGAVKALPLIGEGVAAAAELVPKTFEIAKAAIVGAVAFDPHASRMSDMVQDTPMANPVSEYMSAHPEDSAARGRLMNAFESIGMDVTLISVFMGAGKVWKYYKAGDHAGAAQAAKELDDEITKQSVGSGDGGPALAPDASAGTAEAAGTPLPTEGQPAGPLPSDVQAAGTETSGTPTGGLDGATVRGPDGAGASSGPDGAVGAEPGAGAGKGIGPIDGGPATATPNAGQAALDAGTQLNSAQPRIRLSDENTAGLVKSMEDDAFAFSQFGGWYQALEGGHVFGAGERVPWAKINTDPDVANFTARVVDAIAERADAIQGGAVLTDKRLNSVVGMMGQLYNADPATIIGSIQRAGKDASTMVANMEAGYLVANRMLQDTHALAARISMGDFTEFGGFEAAMTELKKRASIAGSVYASARSMTAAGGRMVRRMQTQFAIDPEMVAKLGNMDSQQLLKVLGNTDGDPKAIAKLLRNSLWSKSVDALQFLYVNNLVSGFKTQLINFTTNSYMLGARPLERIIGGALSGNARAYKEAIKQYQYMGSSFMESWRSAGQAFLSNDSVLAPHKTDVRGTGLEGGADLRTILAGQKPWGSVGGLLANATHIAVAGLGLPTRTLGAVDEMMKQMTYRSKLQASAYMDGIEQGTQQGFKGTSLQAFVESFVKDKLYAGFDDAGKATDPAALREAQISTFQQDLLPASFGRTLQTGIAQHPGLKLIVPFIKTPTNVIRYGWKMTPLLNLAQKEYREMLTGVHGAEAKAQAIGQMTMGTMFMGATAYLVSQGSITGGGPSDPKAKKALMATGWQPYSLVHENDDGTKTFVPFGRLDPIAIPMGMMADLQDAYHALSYQDTPEFTAAVGSMLIAMSKQFTSKTYLLGISQFMAAMMDPDRSAKKVLASTVANFVPFAAFQRQVNPDPHLHDARGILDKMLTTVPGMGDGVPLVYDPWGQPVMRPGLWSSDDGSVVDHEVQRLAIETGHTIESASPVVSGVDLRDITLSTGENAYERYQQLSGNAGQGDSLKTVIAHRMQTDAYQLAPDGDAGTKGTKLAILSDIVSKWRQRAMSHLKQDVNVRDAFRSADLKARAQFVKNKMDFNKQPDAGGLDALLKAFP